MAETFNESLHTPDAEVHYSANALTSALSEGAKKSGSIDERPIEILLGWALNTNSWLGPELFDFPEGLRYRTQNIQGLADVSGFSPDVAWSRGATPMAQVELKRDAQMNWTERNGYQLDWYARNHGEGKHLTVLLPEFRKARFKKLMDEELEASEKWTIVTYEETLAQLLSRGISGLPDGQVRELVLLIIRSQGI